METTSYSGHSSVVLRSLHLFHALPFCFFVLVETNGRGESSDEMFTYKCGTIFDFGKC